MAKTPRQLQVVEPASAQRAWTSCASERFEKLLHAVDAALHRELEMQHALAEAAAKSSEMAARIEELSEATRRGR